MEKKTKLNSKFEFTGQNSSRLKAKENNSISKNIVNEKSLLPPINSTITKKCPICQTSIQKVIFNSHYDSHPSKILDYIYIGSFANALKNKELQMINAGYILNCAIECRNAFPNNYEYLKLPIVDFPNIDISKYFEEGFSFIEKARNANSVVLVHCQMGKSRSVSIVIAYLMKYHKYSFSAAFEYVKSKRKIAFPNIGFMKKLKEFDLLLQKK